MAGNVIILDAVKHAEFLAEGRKDEYSKEEMKPGDRVVVCGTCLKVYQEGSWLAYGSSHPCGNTNTVDFIPHGLGPVILSFEPQEAFYDGSGAVTLRWEVVQSPSEVTLNGQAVDPVGSEQCVPETTTHYELVARSRLGNTVRRSAVINVEILPLEIEYFNISQDYLDRPGTVTLSWKVLHASSVFIDHDIGPVDAEGQVEVSPRKDTTYVLQAFNNHGERGEVQCSVEVNKEPPVVWFEPDTYHLDEEKPVILKWKVEGAETVKITPYLGLVEAEGEREVQIQEKIKFVLTATSYFQQETTRSLTMTVSEDNPIIPYFLFSPGIIFSGNPASLKWKISDNKLSCHGRIDPTIGEVPAEGQLPVWPVADATYALKGFNYFHNTAFQTTAVRVLDMPQNQVALPETRMHSRLNVPISTFNHYPELAVRAQRNYTRPEKQFLNRNLSFHP